MKAISNQLARNWHIKPQDQTEGFDSWELFGLTPLSGGRHGYMPPLFKTKQKISVRPITRVIGLTLVHISGSADFGFIPLL